MRIGRVSKAWSLEVEEQSLEGMWMSEGERIAIGGEEWNGNGKDGTLA